jgi:hypothetical protein
MRKATLFIAALVSLVSAAGCRRVVILSFKAGNFPDVDRLFVEGVEPQKDQRELTGLGQTIGYYDVSATTIKVRVTACAGAELVSDHTDRYDIHDDEVTISIDGLIDSSPGTMTKASCRGGLGRLDGGSNDSGAGGELGGAGGGGPGGAGGDATSGMGGDAAGGSGTGGNGQGGAGAGGAGGTDGGASDSAECGTDTHGPTCDPPSGDPGVGDIPTPPTISADCVQYCSDIRTKCGAVYDSDDACQRYCALAGWTVTDPPPANSLACRNHYLSAATPITSDCLRAGPTGNAACGFACRNFCDAWVGICNPDPSEASACLTVCTTKMIAAPTAEPTCRFQLLQRALYDKRYCDYVKLNSCLTCQ